jgi:hypothetical protein
LQKLFDSLAQGSLVRLHSTSRDRRITDIQLDRD